MPLNVSIRVLDQVFQGKHSFIPDAIVSDVIEQVLNTYGRNPQCELYYAELVSNDEHHRVLISDESLADNDIDIESASILIREATAEEIEQKKAIDENSAQADDEADNENNGEIEHDNNYGHDVSEADDDFDNMNASRPSYDGFGTEIAEDLEALNQYECQTKARNRARNALSDQCSKCSKSWVSGTYYVCKCQYTACRGCNPPLNEKCPKCNYPISLYSSR